MSRKLLLLFIVFQIFNLNRGYSATGIDSLKISTSCFICHKETENLPADISPDDAHLQAAISCAGCHGGDDTSDDPDISMSRTHGFKGVPLKKDIPQLCGKCHSDINFMRKYQPRIATDQVDQYFQSIHGKQLLRGDQKVADCTSCHTAHAIRPVSDPRSSVYALNLPATCNHCHGDSMLMSKYKLKSDAYKMYRSSVHGIALLDRKDTNAPACNDCHGNHGATPPGIESIAYVCGTCHMKNSQYFSESKMSKVFSSSGFHSCEQCHGHHYIIPPTDQMLGTDSSSVCIKCHKSGDAGYQAAKDIYDQVTGFAKLYAQAEQQLQEIRTKGMNDVEIGFMLQESRQHLIQLRTLVHTFDVGKISSKSAEGQKLLAGAIDMEKFEIKEFYWRRFGFGISTLAFVILIIALILKIRQKK